MCCFSMDRKDPVIWKTLATLWTDVLNDNLSQLAEVPLVCDQVVRIRI